jgi:subtilase family serine protease
MRNRLFTAATVLAVAATIGATALATQADAAPAAAASSSSSTAAAVILPACARPAASDDARCMLELRSGRSGGLGVRGPAAHSAAAAALPDGYGPSQLQSAYQLPATGGSGQTVAVVDAGDDAAAEADLAVYRSTYGLTPCTTANGCFQKVDQTGQASPLPADQGWDVEIALDLDMVSAICQECHILLVEADSEGAADLGAAENTAVALGATEVSNSYGIPESGGTAAVAADYSHPGVAITASSGDDGYRIPTEPAVFTSVIAVGGTTLTAASGTARGWTESAWGGAGSGCSAWIAKPSWQNDAVCPGRTVADISAVADPATGVSVYNTTALGGWAVAGGTSVASPVIASIIALAGNPAAFPDAAPLYSAAQGLNDVTTGTNATDPAMCAGSYLCLAGTGYDGPTGNGTPAGLAAF